MIDIGIPRGVAGAVHSVKGKESVTKEEIIAVVDTMTADVYKSGNIAVNPRSSTIDDIRALYLKAL